MAHSPDASPPRTVHWLLGGILAILVGAALGRLSAVAVPLVLGLLVALLLAPFERWASTYLPGPLRWLGRVLSLVVMLVVLGVFIGGLAYCAQALVATGPGLSEELDGLLSLNEDVAESLPPMMADLLRGTADTLGTRLAESAMGLAQGITGALGGFMLTLILVVFLALLALGETRLWAEKADGPERSTRDWATVAHAISARLRRFLAVRTLMGALQGGLYVAWLWWFGIDLLPVWAVLTFLLTFIPNIGSMIAGVLPVVYALLTRDFQTALLVAGGLFAIEQVVGNFLDPMLQGREVSVSPLVVLAMVLLWGGLWGVAGAFLAVPITIVLIGVFAHIPALRPVAVFLSNLPDERALCDALDV